MDGPSKSGRPKVLKWTVQGVKVDVQRDERARPEFKRYPTFVITLLWYPFFGTVKNVSFSAFQDCVRDKKIFESLIAFQNFII